MVEQEGEFLARRAAGLARQFARPEIERIRPRRDDAKIGRLHRRRSSRGFARAGVDDRERDALFLEHCQGALKFAPRHPLDQDVLRLACLRPFGQRHQRIGIDEENPFALLMSGDGETSGERALPRAAFLGHECNRTHEVQPSGCCHGPLVCTRFAAWSLSAMIR